MGHPDYGQGAGTLSKAAGYVNQAQQKLTNLNQTMQTELDGLRGQWAGAGSQAFHILKEAWGEKHQVIVSELQRFEDSLGQTEKINMSNDDEQGANMARIQAAVESAPRT